MESDSSIDNKITNNAGSKSLIDRLGGDTPRNNIFAYFILEESSSVSYDPLAQKCSLSAEEVRRILKGLTQEGVLNNGTQQVYSLNIKSPAVRAALKDYFAGGLERIKTALRNPESKEGDEYSQVMQLERSLNKLEEELGPSKEFSEVDDAFYNLYGEIDMLCEGTWEYQTRKRDLLRNKIFIYFIKKQSIDVDPEAIIQERSLEKAEVNRTLRDLTEREVICSSQPGRYSLNLKSLTVKEILKDYFIGGLRRIEQALTGKKPGEETIPLHIAYQIIENLDEETEHFGDPPELAEFLDQFSELYVQLDMNIEDRSESLARRQ